MKEKEDEIDKKLNVFIIKDGRNIKCFYDLVFFEPYIGDKDFVAFNDDATITIRIKEKDRFHRYTYSLHKYDIETFEEIRK
jgi:hypothetical protein